MIDPVSPHPAGPGITTDPFPNAVKIHVDGTLPGVRVPMREIRVSPTRTSKGLTVENPPVTVYDTSGPYTDPAAEIDLRRGLPPLRLDWIRGRGDVEELATSPPSRTAAGTDPKLDAVRFPHLRRPRVARAGANVTQMHDARLGVVTRRWSSSPSARTSGARLHARRWAGGPGEAAWRSTRGTRSARRSRR